MAVFHDAPGRCLLYHYLITDRGTVYMGVQLNGLEANMTYADLSPGSAVWRIRSSTAFKRH